MKRTIAMAFLAGASLASGVEPIISAGITTSLGSFTIKLYHEDSPRTVANFIRLAEGRVPWIDETNGFVRYEPFYNGSEFHYVDGGRLSQAGLRGGHGPASNIRDEVDNGLSFNKKYLVAMAGRGPNTGSSEFFVTAANTIAHDSENTIFGEIIKGFDVCDVINAVPTDSESRPRTPVTINSVTISRGGVEFDENAQNLPEITGVSPQMVIYPAGVTLGYRQPARSLSYCYLSPDFEWWMKLKRYLDVNSAPLLSWNLRSYTAGQPRHFFATSIIGYGSDAVMPKSLRTKTLTMLMISNEGGVTTGATFLFNSTGGGTYTFDQGGSGIISSHTWNPDGYGGDVHMFLDGSDILDARIGLDSSTNLKIEGRNTSTYKTSVDGSILSMDFRGIFTLSR